MKSSWVKALSCSETDETTVALAPMGTLPVVALWVSNRTRKNLAELLLSYDRCPWTTRGRCVPKREKFLFSRTYYTWGLDFLFLGKCSFFYGGSPCLPVSSSQIIGDWHWVSLPYGVSYFLGRNLLISKSLLGAIRS